MPELPEVELKKKRLDRQLPLHVTRVDIFEKSFIENHSEKEIKKAFEGKTFISTFRHGKYLFVKSSGEHWLVLHFGMSGDIAFIPSGSDPPRFSRALFHCKASVDLAILSMRKLGKLSLTTAPDDYLRSHRIGPDALQISLERFRQALSGRTAIIKSLLLNQCILAGVGNLYADEALYQARIRPNRRSNTLSDREITVLYESIRNGLKASIKVDTDFDRMSDNYLLAHRQSDRNCPRGHGKLTVQTVAGRTSYFCSKCQK